MWIVTQDYIKGQLVYLVENSATGERRGEFDWQARAQEFADELNRREKAHDLLVSSNILLRHLSRGGITK